MTRTVETIVDRIGVGESPRWRDGRVWFCDWLSGEVLRP
jgi:sugar lactone lactonase YvrE